MHDTSGAGNGRTGIETPLRNHFFHGKMMDVYHFDLETNYFIGHRRRLNRLIAGIGVVCGLNVEAGRDPDTITVSSGFALDGWGREIVVPKRTGQLKIPPEVIDRARRIEDDECDDPCVRAMLCYHECLSDPTPVLAGDCNDPDPCAPGAVREQYKIVFAPGCARPRRTDCREPSLISGGRLDYGALVRWISVTRDCGRLPADPCIPLANLIVGETETGQYHCDPERIDITVRPIVYTNRLLAELIQCLLQMDARQSDDE